MEYEDDFVPLNVSEVDFAFRVYGDNILECENFMRWVQNERVSNFKLVARKGPLDRPIFILSDPLSKSSKIALQLCPYFGGTGPSVLWPHNPLAGVFDEKTDVVVTRVLEDGTESRAIFAIEFVDALMAGNQGWQRSRRAINAAESDLTYLYVLPMIGWERDSEGLILRHPRFLPATVCLAQLTLCSEHGIPSLQIYTLTDWSDYADREHYTLPVDYKQFRGERNAIEFASQLLRIEIDKANNPRTLLKQVLEQILKEMLSVAKTYSSFGESNLPIHINHPALDPANRNEAAATYAEALVQKRPVEGRYALHKISETEFIQHGALFWKDAQKKTCSPRFRNEVLAFLNWKSSTDRDYKIRYLRRWGLVVDPDSTSEELDRQAVANKRLLPTTYKDNKSEATLVPNRRALREIIEAAYPTVERDVLEWVYPRRNPENLPAIFLVPLYAYKPTGDSRPDRGLLPLLKALFPSIVKKDRTLVIVYSKHTPNNWKSLVKAGGNELWNSVASVAGALIVDKTSDGMLLEDRTAQTRLS